MQTRYETIEDVVEHIETRDDFVAFLRLLADDSRKKIDWENGDLNSFLSALGGFAQDMDGYYQDTEVNSREPSWKLFAAMLLAARVYE